MENRKDFTRIEQERHLHSTRFKVYMVAWSAFFLFILSSKVVDDIRHLAADIVIERTEMASSAYSSLESIPPAD